MDKFFMIGSHCHVARHFSVSSSASVSRRMMTATKKLQLGSELGLLVMWAISRDSVNT